MIERLYIQNFRCLDSLTLVFAGNSSILIIGKNGAGKSTIRKALSILQTICRGSGRVDKLISPNDFAFGRTDRPIRFELEAKIGGRTFNYSVSFDWPETFREARILNESASVDGQNIFNRDQGQVDLASGANFGLNWHVFALPVINERPPANSMQDLKTYLASLILIAPIPTMIRGFSDHSTTELHDDATNFASCLRGLLERKPAAYAKFAESIEAVMPDFSAIENTERGKDGQQLMVSFKNPNEESGLTVEFDSLSDGEKCFFLNAYIMASTAVGIPVVCMWDEPDNHLSLSEIGQFIASMRKTARGGGQFIATSHHPETVRKFPDDATIVLTRKSHLEPTVPRFLKEFRYSGDLIDALIRDEVIG